MTIRDFIILLHGIDRARGGRKNDVDRVVRFALELGIRGKPWPEPLRDFMREHLNKAPKGRGSPKGPRNSQRDRAIYEAVQAGESAAQVAARTHEGTRVDIRRIEQIVKKQREHKEAVDKLVENSILNPRRRN